MKQLANGKPTTHCTKNKPILSLLSLFCSYIAFLIPLHPSISFFLSLFFFCLLHTQTQKHRVVFAPQLKPSIEKKHRNRKIPMLFLFIKKPSIHLYLHIILP